MVAGREKDSSAMSYHDPEGNWCGIGSAGCTPLLTHTLVLTEIPTQ
jgi:hypothetical protein